MPQYNQYNQYNPYSQFNQFNQPKQYKQCRYCKQMIDKRAKACPHCLRNLGTSPAHVVLAIIIVLVGFFIIGNIANGYLSAQEHDQVNKTYTESEYKAQCAKVTYKELVRDKNMMSGQLVTISGTVGQLMPGTVRLDIGDGSIAVDYTSKIVDCNLLEGDKITVWGKAMGSRTYDTLFGEKDFPSIDAYYIEINRSK